MHHASISLPVKRLGSFWVKLSGLVMLLHPSLDAPLELHERGVASLPLNFPDRAVCGDSRDLGITHSFSEKDEVVVHEAVISDRRAFIGGGRKA